MNEQTHNKLEWVQPVLLKLDNFDTTAGGFVFFNTEITSGYTYHHSVNPVSVTHIHSSYQPLTT